MMTKGDYLLLAFALLAVAFALFVGIPVVFAP